MVISTLSFFYKQLESGLSPESCLYFHGFRGSKSLNDCLVVWPRKHKFPWFDQVTYVFEECNNSQDSKSIFMIWDFKIFPIMLLRQLNFGALSVSKVFYVYCKRKTPFFFMQFAIRG